MASALPPSATTSTTYTVVNDTDIASGGGCWLKNAVSTNRQSRNATVKTHTARLFNKLGVNRRIKAVEARRKFGLIPLIG